MRLPPPMRRLPAEPYLPLINIVFLLLIFFLIVARLAPAAPLKVVPPTARGQVIAGKYALYLGADGTIAHGGAVGDAALAGLASSLAQACPAPCTSPPVLLLNVDGRTVGTDLAALLQQAARIGWGTVQVVTETP
jgi:biopolymer transport protein ExbD